MGVDIASADKASIQIRRSVIIILGTADRAQYAFLPAVVDGIRQRNINQIEGSSP